MIYNIAHQIVHVLNFIICLFAVREFIEWRWERLKAVNHLVLGRCGYRNNPFL